MEETFAIPLNISGVKIEKVEINKGEEFIIVGDNGDRTPRYALAFDMRVKS